VKNNQNFLFQFHGYRSFKYGMFFSSHHGRHFKREFDHTSVRLVRSDVMLGALITEHLNTPDRIIRSLCLCVCVSRLWNASESWPYL